jgi:lysylphosphatidylglycerol synthase-like protein
MRMLKRILDEYVSRHHRDHGRREVAVSLAIAVTLAAAALGGVAWAAGFGAVLGRLGHPHWFWFGMALAGLVASLLGYTFAYRELARADEGPDLPVRHVGALVTTGFGVFIPRGGFSLDHEALLDAGVPPREAELRVRGLGLLEYAILAPAAFGAALYLLVDGFPDRAGVQLSWIVGVPVGTVVTLGLLRYRTRIRRGGRFRRAVGRFLEAVARLVKLFAPPRKRSIGAALGMCVYWAGDMFVLWACLAAFMQHGRPPVSALILAYATGYALSRRTLPFAGAGAVEALLPFALTWVGVPLAPALLSVFAYRIFNLWLPAIPGTPGLLVLKRRPVGIGSQL